MKILVTGAAGFIGSHMAQRLQNLGHDVIGVDNFSPYYDIDLKEANAQDLRDVGINMLELDLREPVAYQALPKDIEYIFHFAAQPGIATTSSFQDYLTNNVIATQQLLYYARTCEDLKLFVNIATSSIYGLEATFNEDEVPRPASHYGVTKLAAEQLVLAYSRANLMQACSLRLYSVYGPRERPDKLYTKLIECGLNDEPFPLFEGSDKHLRSFTYVQDIIDGIVSVIGRESAVNEEIINLGTEVESTTAQGIATVEEILNKKIKLEVIPKRPGDQSRTCAVIDKARRLLDYNPQTTLKEGLMAQVEWCKGRL